MTQTIGFMAHDHDTCVSTSLRMIREYCADQNLQLTPTREFVLHVLLEEHRAMGAYDILERLKIEGLGSQPPVVYRALDFLVGHGFVHKLERLNAFIACTHHDGDHLPAFFICSNCDTVAETTLPHLVTPVSEAAGRLNFALDRLTLEAEGLCPACQEDSA